MRDSEFGIWKAETEDRSMKAAKGCNRAWGIGHGAMSIQLDIRNCG